MSSLGTRDHPAVIWGTRSLLTQRKNTHYWELLSCFPLWWQKSTVQILCSLEKQRKKQRLLQKFSFPSERKSFCSKVLCPVSLPISALPPSPAAKGLRQLGLAQMPQKVCIEMSNFFLIFFFPQNKEDNVITTPALGWGRISAQRRDEGIAPPGPPGPCPHRTPSPGVGPTLTARPGSRGEMHRHVWRSQGGGQRHRAARASRVRQSEADHLNSPWLLLRGRENPCKASGRFE